LKELESKLEQTEKEKNEFVKNEETVLQQITSVKKENQELKARKSQLNSSVRHFCVQQIHNVSVFFF
jgi:hypothetical protein